MRWGAIDTTEGTESTFLGRAREEPEPLLERASEELLAVILISRPAVRFGEGGICKDVLREWADRQPLPLLDEANDGDELAIQSGGLPRRNVSRRNLPRR